MKGFVDIELKNPKTGEVVKKIKDHNLVTNFFQEFFRELGPTKGLPSTYTIEDLIGGILLYKDQIEADANNVLFPKGNQMIGNAATGTVNGPGTAVTEMGSYVQNECKWIGNTYQQQWQWSSGQAVGTFNCVALTSRLWGYIGDGNETSKKEYLNSNFNVRGYNLGTDTLRAYRQGCSMLERKNNHVDKMDSAIFSSSDSNAGTTGKIPIHRYYFPETEVNFRYGYNSNAKIIEEIDLDIPENIRSEFIGSKKYVSCIIGYGGSHGGELAASITRDESGAHWCATNDYLTSTSKKIYCFDYSDGVIAAQAIELPEAVWNNLRTNNSSLNYSNFFFCCNGDKLLATRRYNYTNTKIFVIDRNNLTVSEITHEYNGQYNEELYGILGYHDGIWWFDTYYNNNVNRPYKVDTSKNHAWFLNGYAYYLGGDYGDAAQFMPDADYKLASMNGAGNGFRRWANYLATIYNLPSPVTKTADLELTITYTISFDEEE